jgi:SAM-dependent methyltransferase
MLRLTKRIHRRLVQAPRTSLLAGPLARLAGPASSLLDVGAGDGEVAEAVGTSCGTGRVEGVDVLRQPHARIPVTTYDGARLPFPDAAFEVVLLSDVIHHADDPALLLSEAARVAERAVVIKDHFAFGPASRALLLALDLFANGLYGIRVRGAYLSPAAWLRLAADAGLEIDALVWPLDVHHDPIRRITRSEVQFAARLVRRAAS